MPSYLTGVFDELTDSELLALTEAEAGYRLPASHHLPQLLYVCFQGEDQLINLAPQLGHACSPTRWAAAEVHRAPAAAAAARVCAGAA